MSVCPSNYLSICLSIDLSIYLPFLSIYLPIYLCINICASICHGCSNDHINRIYANGFSDWVDKRYFRIPIAFIVVTSSADNQQSHRGPGCSWWEAPVVAEHGTPWITGHKFLPYVARTLQRHASCWIWRPLSLWILEWGKDKKARGAKLKTPASDAKSDGASLHHYSAQQPLPVGMRSTFLFSGGSRIGVGGAAVALSLQGPQANAQRTSWYDANEKRTLLVKPRGWKGWLREPGRAGFGLLGGQLARPRCTLRSQIADMRFLSRKHRCTCWIWRSGEI